MIPIGTKHQVERTVTEEMTALRVGSGELPVFATPCMAALMEHAALTALAPFLEPGQGSVGTRLELTHDAPTPVGMTVWAEAEAVSVSANGRMVEFAVRAWDARGPIGQGTHTRAVIRNDRFLEKCQAKPADPSGV